MIVATAIAVAVLQAPAASTGRATIPNDERAIAHALNRLAFGARPGDVARITQATLAKWIEEQLRPDRVPDRAMNARLERLSTLTLEPETLARDFIAARQERRRRQQEAGTSGQSPVPSRMRPDMRPGRQVFAELAEAKLVRAVYSERQLEEVLVDFWFNHFNVFARKGQTEIYVGAYERDAIRPHVLGSFRELLGATAKSPAMLVYLDNWMSADPASTRDGSLIAGVQGVRRRAPRGQMPPSQKARGRRMRGLNENYARELLELHTLGVDGGYT
ncbi:MAG: DUF1800 family protein, partial [Vicinamibacterales bacterium]